MKIHSRTKGNNKRKLPTIDGNNCGNGIQDLQNTSEKQNKGANSIDPEKNLKEIISNIKPLAEEEKSDINSAIKETSNTPLNSKIPKKYSTTKNGNKKIINWANSDKKVEGNQNLKNDVVIPEDFSHNSDFQVN